MMYTKLIETLRQVARDRTTIHYEDIAPMLKLDMNDPSHRVRIGEILGDISRGEHDQGRPLLSAVVTQKGEERPGKGFFTLATELGLFSGLDEEAFFARELTKAHDFWSSQEDAPMASTP